MQYMTKFGEF